MDGYFCLGAWCRGKRGKKGPCDNFSESLEKSWKYVLTFLILLPPNPVINLSEQNT